MTLQQLMGYMRRAIDDYQMIQEGDKIAIGISGGKDSISLALALRGLQDYYPKHFELEAFTVSLGFPEFDVTGIRELMNRYDIPYSLIETDIGKIVFEDRREKNPCSLCAKLRKGSFNKYAAAHGCNKVALGHHTEDVVETFYLSLFYEGRLHTFSPVTQWDRSGLVAIRPMIYVKEADIISFARREQLPIVKNPCPADGNTQREIMKNQIREWNRQFGHNTERTFKAIQDGLPDWEVLSPSSIRRRKGDQ